MTFFYRTPSNNDETCTSCGWPILPRTEAAQIDNDNMDCFHLECYETRLEDFREEVAW